MLRMDATEADAFKGSFLRTWTSRRRRRGGGGGAGGEEEEEAEEEEEEAVEAEVEKAETAITAWSQLIKVHIPSSREN